MSDEEHARWEPPWAPEWFYLLSIELEGQPPIRFSATVPDLDTGDFAGAVVQRIGGASSRDWAFRRRLYFLIGLVTVAGGKIEAAMKRAILVGRRDRRAEMALVDENWTTLERKLRMVAKAQTSEPTIPGWGEAVIRVLDWGVKERAKERRDDVVHAYWWDWADTNVTRSRFARSGQTFTIGGSLDALRHDGEVLLSYAGLLEELSGPFWLNLYLPREVPPGEEQAITHRWEPHVRVTPPVAGE